MSTLEEKPGKPTPPSIFSIKENLSRFKAEMDARRELNELVRRTNFNWVFDLNYEIGKKHLRQMLFRTERTLKKSIESGVDIERLEEIQKTHDQLTFILGEYTEKQMQVIKYRERISFLEDQMSKNG